MFTNETTSFILRCVRKTIWMLLVLWGITLVSFFVIHLAPGTPTDMPATLPTVMTVMGKTRCLPRSISFPQKDSDS